jgi:peptidyl-prolyl cis-trans isomerase C
MTSGVAVAKGSGIVVTADELKAKLDEQSPMVRARYTTLERKKEFLENMIRFELLAAEAKRRELDKDPEVQATVKKIMVQRLVRMTYEADSSKTASDDEVRRYYDEHLEEFVKPERVRVSQVFLRGQKGTPERAPRAADAKKALARLKAERASNPLAFANLAREVSEDLATKASGGDLGFRSREELEKTWGREVAEAAISLRNVGDESAIVESERGFHLLRLTGRQPAVSRGFDEVKPQLAARVGREKRSKEFEEVVKALREKADIQIVDAELEKVQVSAAAAPFPTEAHARQLGAPAPAARR